jgi:hydroxymethylglutaryl-CoA lyase
MSKFPIKIIEVGPRDGLQNEKKAISTEDKLTFIDLLSACGFKEIEAGSFVSPKWVPQMADADKIFKHLKIHGKADIAYTALVPNMKGMEAAVACGVKKVAVFTAASETFNQKNINCSIAESFQRILPILKRADEENIQTRGYVSTAFVCPYEGEVQVDQVLPVVQQLVDAGVQDISIGDTIGKATPHGVSILSELLLKRFPTTQFAMHFHDTYGNALGNVEAALKSDIQCFDSSAAGLGGCPYAPGAKGNVSTNALVKYLHEKGYETGINEEELEKSATFIRGVVG